MKKMGAGIEPLRDDCPNHKATTTTFKKYIIDRCFSFDDFSTKFVHPLNTKCSQGFEKLRRVIFENREFLKQY